MDKSKHNLRLNFLLLLFAISSFSLFAQKNNTENEATVKTNSDQSGTTQTNTPSVDGRLILHSSTTGIHHVREIPRGGLQVNNGTIYGDDIRTSEDDILNNSSSQTSSLVNCPMMYVQVNIPFLQSCIHSSAQVNFCNHGTATAFGAFVDLELPAELVLDSADLPYTIVGTNLYRFLLGTIAISACNQFDIYFTTNCDSNLIGEDHCINAHIYPDTLCNGVQNTPLITVDATCVNGKTTFTLNNHGTAVTMDQHMQLIIIEDHLLAGGNHRELINQSLVLESGGTFTRGYTPGIPDYLLTLTDNLGNQLVHSSVKSCSIGASNTLINTSHAHQSIDQFGNGSLLPSISQACAENGQATTQTNSTFAPTNTNSESSDGNTTTRDNTSNLEAFELEETTVLVFPNPFSQSATVRIEGSISDHFMFRLYDATGRMVQLMEIEGQKEFQIERGNLLQGMYLYQIESEGQLIDAGKVIIK
jgi:hypothetical protein